jgi:hypothetical protein
MSEATQASAIVGAWLAGVDHVAPSLPSWIAPRQLTEESSVSTHVGLPSHSNAGLAPPTRMPSLPPMTAPRISVHPALDAPPPYPDLREENAALRRQIVEMALMTARVRRDVLEASEGELVKLAVAIGERIARQELRTDPKIVLGWVREAIDMSTTKDHVVVAVAPDLAAALAPTDWEAIAVGSVRVETDASLAPFHCEVRAGASAVEVNVAERVAAMSRELGVSS